MNSMWFNGTRITGFGGRGVVEKFVLLKHSEDQKNLVAWEGQLDFKSLLEKIAECELGFTIAAGRVADGKICYLDINNFESPAEPDMLERCLIEAEILG